MPLKPGEVERFPTSFLEMTTKFFFLKKKKKKKKKTNILGRLH